MKKILAGVSTLLFCALAGPAGQCQGAGLGTGGVDPGRPHAQYAPAEQRYLHYHDFGNKGFVRIYPNLYGDNLHNWEPEGCRMQARWHKVEYYDKHTGWHVEERWW